MFIHDLPKLTINTHTATLMELAKDLYQVWNHSPATRQEKSKGLFLFLHQISNTLIFDKNDQESFLDNEMIQLPWDQAATLSKDLDMEYGSRTARKRISNPVKKKARIQVPLSEMTDPPDNLYIRIADFKKQNEGYFSQLSKFCYRDEATPGFILQRVFSVLELGRGWIGSVDSEFMKKFALFVCGCACEVLDRTRLDHQRVEDVLGEEEVRKCRNAVAFVKAVGPDSLMYDRPSVDELVEDRGREELEDLREKLRFNRIQIIHQRLVKRFLIDGFDAEIPKFVKKLLL